MGVLLFDMITRSQTNNQSSCSFPHISRTSRIIMILLQIWSKFIKKYLTHLKRESGTWGFEGNLDERWPVLNEEILKELCRSRTCLVLRNKGCFRADRKYS
jgi:hypothetical protein